jgi:choline monooxygenase
MSVDGTQVLERTLEVVQKKMPDLAERYMRVPLTYYTNEEVAARERHLFMTQPIPLLAASEIAEPNSYFVRMAMGRSILLTRDDDGVAHAFLNYCRHRGAEPAQGCGKARGFSCPYHSWTYNTKGELIGTPLPDRNASLDYRKLALVELASEERHGFIWVILSPGSAIDVSAHLGEVDAQIAALGCQKMKYHSSLKHEPIAANWKTVAEGLVEALHVPFVHRATFNVDPAGAGERFQSISSVDLAVYDRFGPHVRYSLPMFGQQEIAGIRQLHASGRAIPAGRIAQVWLLSPGVLLAQELYGLIYADLEPGPTIGSTLFRYGWMSPVEEAPANLPSPSDMAHRAAVAVHEDAPVWAACARGLEFGGHGHVMIGKNEKGVHLFHEALADQTGYDGLSYV